MGKAAISEVVENESKRRNFVPGNFDARRPCQVRRAWSLARSSWFATICRLHSTMSIPFQRRGREILDTLTVIIRINCLQKRMQPRSCALLWWQTARCQWFGVDDGCQEVRRVSILTLLALHRANEFVLKPKRTHYNQYPTPTTSCPPSTDESH